MVLVVELHAVNVYAPTPHPVRHCWHDVDAIDGANVSDKQLVHTVLSDILEYEPGVHG